ncbi:hypothetical protein [Pseudidiomarina sp.]
MSNIYKNDLAPLWLHIMGGVLVAGVVAPIILENEYPSFNESGKLDRTS